MCRQQHCLPPKELIMPLLSLFANQFQDRFIIDRTGLADIARVETDADRGDATLNWTGPNLRIGEPGQLRRAIAPLGFVLRIATFDEFRIHVKFADGIIDPAVAEEVRADSTFILEQGLIDPNQVSFRSAKFRDRFIRHRNFQLFAEPINTPQDHQDATFRIAAPLQQAGVMNAPESVTP
jgi:hypothetical protein